MRILLTGAGGFIGGALARRLGARGDITLIACAREGDAGRRGFDLLDADLLKRALIETRPDVVVHAAGRTSGPPSALLRDNALASARLAETLAETAPAARLLLFGSAAQYGAGAAGRPWRETDPCTPGEAYGIAKLAAERCAFLAAATSGVRVTALRLFNVVAAAPGGGQVFSSFVAKAAAAASGPEPRRISMGPLGAVRDFVALDDVIRAAEAVIDRGAWGEVINVCTGEGRTARALIEATLSAMRRPPALEEVGAPGGELAWSVGDPGRCGELLGFVPDADLSALTGRAAGLVDAAAGKGADARSCA
ncbi:MAG TPA: NAD(P)-dependent oxidoreductase [Caulobacteraceae bacterium]|nr:NAD(P)-dependent oxidoreductase [Caulobacteraceae bacterium]